MTDTFTFTTALNFTRLTDGRVAVDNGIGDEPLGHVLPDGSLDEPLADWCDGFPPDAAADFRDGITADAAHARRILQPGWRLSLEPRAA